MIKVTVKAQGKASFFITTLQKDTHTHNKKLTGLRQCAQRVIQTLFQATWQACLILMACNVMAWLLCWQFHIFNKTLCHCREALHGWWKCKRQISAAALTRVPLSGSLADLGLISTTSCMIDKWKGNLRCSPESATSYLVSSCFFFSSLGFCLAKK